MSIDHETETIITLGEACRAFPPKGVSDATLARWIHRGFKDMMLNSFVKLETLVIGGRRFTSREAIARFIAAQNKENSEAPTITPAQRQRQSEAAQAELEKLGI